MDEYKADVFDVLLMEEDINNLPVSIIMKNVVENPHDWLLSTITDESGKIVLIAQCSLPFDLLLYVPSVCEPDGQNTENHEQQCAEALKMLASELKHIDFKPPGVLAKSGLSQRFAKTYCGGVDCELYMSMVLMRLEKLAEYNKVPGFCRMLSEDDLSYTPTWEQAFNVDCRFPPSDLSEIEKRIRTRLGQDTHFIWEDGEPVSQAVYGRETPNGGVVNWVYTPPRFRGRGYATSLVAEVSQSLFDRGKDFCCLFADAANPVSRGVYSKLGYYDVDVFDEIKFDIKG